MPGSMNPSPARTGRGYGLSIVPLLLFAIGLEFSWGRLRGMGRQALGSGVLQVVLTTAAGAGLQPPLLKL